MMHLQNRPVSGQVQVSIRAKATVVFTAVYLVLFVVLFFLLDQFAERLIHDNAPKLLGAEATPELMQRIVDTLHSQLGTVTIITFVVSYIVVVIILSILGYGLSRPLAALTRYAEQVETGDYTPVKMPRPGIFRDEVSILSEALISMVDKVQGREQSLKQQVVELQIVIDHSRKAQQVEEITESEFFSNLKARAHELRQAGTTHTTPDASASNPTRDQTITE
jgi:methyl-accepting chemotaxis protein